MITIAICLAITLTIAFTIGKPAQKDFRVIAYIFWTFLGYVVGLVIAVAIGSFLPSRTFSSKPIQLVAMHTADSLNGTFIFGSGSITNETRYTFMERDTDGSFVQKSVAVSDLVHIVEDPNLHNEGYWKTTYTQPYRPAGVSVWTFAATFKSKTVSREEFHVPVGTVVQQFSIK